MLPDWVTADVVGQLTRGTILTVAITMVTGAAAFAVGLAAATSRHEGRGVFRVLGTAFVEVFRNVPALIQIIFFAFAVPNVFSDSARRDLFFDNIVVDAVGTVTRVPIPYYLIAASLALVLNTGAHLAEIIRSGMMTVPSEQVEAARSLGASRFAAWRTITALGGVRSAFPAISTRLIHHLKNTALVSFVSVPDLFQVIQGSINKTFRATEFLVLAAVMYLVLSAVMTIGLRAIENHLGRGLEIRRELGV